MPPLPKLLGWQEIGSHLGNQIIGSLSMFLWKARVWQPSMISIHDGLNLITVERSEPHPLRQFAAALLRLRLSGVQSIEVTFYFDWPFGRVVSVTQTYTLDAQH